MKLRNQEHIPQLVRIFGVGAELAVTYEVRRVTYRGGAKRGEEKEVQIPLPLFKRNRSESKTGIYKATILSSTEIEETKEVAASNAFNVSYWQFHKYFRWLP